MNGKWQTAWDVFINITKEEACSADFTDYEPLIGMVLPREGANTGTTPVHIYGRNFTRAICGGLRCKFGEIESPKAMYISNTHIICETPDISNKLLKRKSLHDNDLETHLTVPIKVDFGDGNFTDIKRNFTYKYNSISHKELLYDIMFKQFRANSTQIDTSRQCKCTSARSDTLHMVSR